MTLESVFGILDVEFCLYYYALMVIGFVAVVFGVLGLLGSALLEKNPKLMVHVYAIVYSGLFYFISRLLYSMCSKSLGN